MSITPAPTPKRRRPTAAQQETEAAYRQAVAEYRPSQGMSVPQSPNAVPVVAPISTAARRVRTGKKKPLLSAPMLVTLITALLLCIITAILSSAASGYAVDLRQKSQQAHQELMQRYPLYYRQQIENAARQYDLNPAFVSAIVLCESSFRPDAESSLGARGLMQLMEKTAAWVAQSFPDVYPYTFDLMYDPARNLSFGCWYLRYLSDKFKGDPVMVASAYHAGQGNVTAWLENPQYSDGSTLHIENIPTDDTKQYVRRVTNAYGIYQVYYYGQTEAASVRSGQ